MDTDQEVEGFSFVLVAVFLTYKYACYTPTLALAGLLAAVLGTFEFNI